MTGCASRHLASAAWGLLLWSGIASLPRNGLCSPCTGEFVLDTATDECVLAANGGFADEPTAWHPRCKGGFTCPPSGPGQQAGACVHSAEAYAACTRRGPLRASPPPTSARRGSPVCNLTGTWGCGGVDCVIEQPSPSSFTVRLEQAQKFLWQNATATIDADGSVFIVYTLQAGGTTARTGQVGPSCTSLAWNDSSTWACEMCGGSPLLDIHIIPHTHCDTGYLETFEEYYQSSVESILTTVTQQLARDPARRFTFVEVAYLERWWRDQSDAVKTQVRQLVAAERFQFANGGWCMPDEAGPTYRDMLINMEKGLGFLEQEFGPKARPRVAWSIDPFGHSTSYAVLNALFQFDFFVVGRIDFQEKAQRFATRSMETYWRPSSVGQEEAGDAMAPGIMTHVLDPIQFYSYPPGFNFEGDARTRVTPENIDSRARDFNKFARQKAAGYNTTSLLVPFGSDFQWANASINYENLDKLMAYVNANTDKFRLNMHYSTPTDYMKALHAKTRTWQVKTDDFESYAIGPEQFLVGFYSSRPDYKGLIRATSAQLRAATNVLTSAVAMGCTQLNVTAEVDALQVLAGELSIAQHHDAITSTQRRHVHRDYVARLSRGQASADASFRRVVATVLAHASGDGAVVPKLETCLHLNESVCEASTAVLSGNTTLAVVAVNPTAHRRNFEAIRVPVPAGAGEYVVTGHDGSPVTAQVLPAWPESPHVHNQTRVAPQGVVVFQRNLSAAGVTTTFVNRQPQPRAGGSHGLTQPSVVATHRAGQPLSLENGLLAVAFNETTGLLQSIRRKADGLVVQASQNLLYYHSSTGGKGPGTGSGNYIFQSDGTGAHFLTGKPDGAPVSVSTVVGPVVSEVRHVFVPGRLEQVFRLYKSSAALEIEYRVGPLDITDGVGKEVISRFSTDVDGNSTWTTDANGYRLEKRRLNHRANLWRGGPEYFQCTDPVSCNYFAVTTRTFLQDAKRRFSVMTDRTQGGSSLAAGQLELMLHRRLASGCRWGMCEQDQYGMEKAGLNDTLGAEVVIKHLVSIDDVAGGSSTSLARMQSRGLNHPAALLFGSTSSATAWPDTARASPDVELPPNVELTTWETLNETATLVRLSHMFSPKEHPTWSQPATVDLCRLVARSCDAAVLTEMTAAGVAPATSIQRLTWLTVEGPAAATEGNPIPFGANHSVTLMPGDIRTFLAVRR